MPLTRLVTVHWGALGVADAGATQATGRLLKLLRDALAVRGLPCAFAWVRENDAGNGMKGAHVHILLHIPPAAGPAFLRRLPSWARLAAGGRLERRTGRIIGPAYVRGAVNTRRIGGTLAARSDVHAANLAGTLAYVLKGVDDDAAAVLGITQREAGGLVQGKRVGWSENIGAAARRNATQRLA
jgi:hypothetical protein